MQITETKEWVISLKIKMSSNDAKIIKNALDCINTATSNLMNSQKKMPVSAIEDIHTISDCLGDLRELRNAVRLTLESNTDEKFELTKDTEDMFPV